MYNKNMNLQKITSFMLKNQPDQTSYLLNQMIDKVNAGDAIKAGGGGSAKLYPTTGQNTDGAMTQKATTDALNAKANSFDVNVALQNKVDKVAGKGLSTNDFTDTDKAAIGRLNRNVMTNATITANTSTDTLNLKDSFANLYTGTTSDATIPFPVASSTSAGVMNSATYSSVLSNSNNIDAILNGAVSISGLSTNPTQAEITNAWKTATGLDTIINRAQVHDSTNEKIWTFYTNVNTWFSAPTSGGQITVNQWTNTSLGIAKGSTEDGQIFAETDGTGSVNGWDALLSTVEGKADSADLATVATTGSYNDLVDKPKEKPYTSLERLGSYIYKISFENIPDYIDSSITPAGCSSLVSGGKLYRNFDWYYDESPTFIVECKGFKGIAINNLLTDTVLDDEILGQLPYRIVDGINDNGIMMSVHVLYNDWDWHGSGDKSVPLHKVPYLIMTNVKSMATISSDLAAIIPNITTTPTFEASEYLAQFLITDGTTTYVLAPPTSASGVYQLINITSNPKLTNFRWVNYTTVARNASYMQDRPNGTERWNNMTTDFSQLRFTKAYEAPTRLSEFIGINETDKDSSDADLTAIYNTAHQKYMTRTRNGELWQTVHNVIYSNKGMEHLYVQENWDRDYVGTHDTVQTDWNQTDTSADDYLKNKPGNATTSTDGLMSSADKTKLNSLYKDRMASISDNFVPSGGDTPINWISALGNGDRVGYYVTNNILTDQPNRYGVLETHIGIGSVAQTFTTLNMGAKWSRSGNQDGWYIPTGKTTAWRRIYDDRDINYIGTSQLVDGAVTSAKIGSGQVTRSNLSLGYTGNYFDKAMGVREDGVVEAGKYVDFHESSDSQADFDSRIQALNGNLSFSGDIYVGNAYSQSAGNKLVKESEISNVVHTGDNGSISTSMIADGAVTAGKIDFSTLGGFGHKRIPLSGVSVPTGWGTNLGTIDISSIGNGRKFLLLLSGWFAYSSGTPQIYIKLTYNGADLSSNDACYLVNQSVIPLPTVFAIGTKVASEDAITIQFSTQATNSLQLRDGKVDIYVVPIA